MNVVKVSCASCGAPIAIPPDIDNLNCAYCGAALAVQRGEGYVTLKLAEQVSKTIQEVGVQTQSSIREGTQVTQIELKRLQLSQELSALQLQLSNIQAEIRSLERQKVDGKIKRQHRELRSHEASLISRINGLQAALVPLSTQVGIGTPQESVPDIRNIPEVKPSSPKDWLVTFLLCIFLGFLGVHRFYTGHILVGLIQLVTLGGFGIWWLIDLVLVLTNRYRDANGNALQNPNLKLGRSCLSGFVVLVIIGFCCGLIAIPLDQAIFGVKTTSSQATSTETSQAGPIFTLVICLAVVLGIIAFVYSMTSEASIWQPIKRILPKGKNKQQEG
jgi:TM2 domain-containing membrane protein YozV